MNRIQYNQLFEAESRNKQQRRRIQRRKRQKSRRLRKKQRRILTSKTQLTKSLSHRTLDSTDFVHYWVPVFGPDPNAPPVTIDTKTPGGPDIVNVIVDNDVSYLALITDAPFGAGAPQPRLYQYNTKSGELIDGIDTLDFPYGVAISSNGSAYAVGLVVTQGGWIAQYNPLPYQLSVIDTLSDILDPRDSTPKQFQLIATSPDGKQALVSCIDAAGGVMVFNTDGTLAVTGVVDLGLGVTSFGVTYNANGSAAFVGDQGGTNIYILDTTDTSIVPPIKATVNVSVTPIFLHMQDSTHLLFTSQSAGNQIFRQLVHSNGDFNGSPESSNASDMSVADGGVNDFTITDGKIYISGQQAPNISGPANVFVYLTSQPLSSSTPTTLNVAPFVNRYNTIPGIASVPGMVVALTQSTQTLGIHPPSDGYMTPITTTNDEVQPSFNSQSFTYSPVSIGVTRPRVPAQIATYQQFPIVSIWSVLQSVSGFAPLIEGKILSDNGVPSAERQFGQPVVGNQINNTLTLELTSGFQGVPIVLEGQTRGSAPIEITFMGGFSADPNALIYYVLDSSDTIVSGPFVVFPNSKMDSNELPNPIRRNCNSHGQWISSQGKPAVRVPLYRTVDSQTVGAYKVIDTSSILNPPETEFLINDRIVFALVNYAGQPFNNTTLANLNNWRMSFAGTTSVTGIPNNEDPTDFQVTGGTNAHFSAQMYASNPFTIASEFVPPLVASAAVIGCEDRLFDKSDADFQDLVFLLTTDTQGPR